MMIINFSNTKVAKHQDEPGMATITAILWSEVKSVLNLVSVEVHTKNKIVIAATHLYMQHRRSKPGLIEDGGNDLGDITTARVRNNCSHYGYDYMERWEVRCFSLK
jgi:hypothetical protein